jgi:hypothetical protein
MDLGHVGTAWELISLVHVVDHPKSSLITPESLMSAVVPAGRSTF